MDVVANARSKYRGYPLERKALTRGRSGQRGVVDQPHADGSDGGPVLTDTRAQTLAPVDTTVFVRESRCGAFRLAR